MQLSGRKARSALLYNNEADSLSSFCHFFRIRRITGNGDKISEGPVADKYLASINDVIVTVLDRSCPHGDGVRTSVRLRKRKGGNLLPLDGGNHEPLLLLLIAIVIDRP